MEKLSFDLNVRKESSTLMKLHNTRMVVKLDYGIHPLTVNVDVLKLAKYVKDNKIILVYFKHGSTNVDSSIFVTHKNGVAIAVNNHLRKAPTEIDSSPDVNRNLTPMCHRNLIKEWKEVSSKALSIGEVMKKLSNKQPTYFDRGPIIVETNDSFDNLDEILGDYANIRKEITKNFESDTKENDTSGSDSKDLDYDPKHDEMFNDDEHILEDIPMGYHVIKTLATNLDIPVRAVQYQMQKQFDVGISKMKVFREKRIASEKMTGSFKEHYSMLIEYAQELINQNPGTTVKIDIQQEPNL
ncbi:hypothetical protein Tco_0731859 [Tanacetum coccineum]